MKKYNSHLNAEQTELCRILKKAQAIALFSHVSPDGDTLGSMLALGLGLEKMGKRVTYYNPDTVPGYLAFLPGAERISRLFPTPCPDVLVFVDCADLARVELTPETLPANITILNIDHHISNQHFGQYNWIDGQAAATGELIHEVLTRLEVDLDQAIAANLYTAVVTDTGSFQYASTTPGTHRLTAEFLETGIDLVQIHYYLYNQKPLAQICLLTRALGSLTLHWGGKLAVMSLTSRDFAECEADQELSEGFINHGRSIAGVEVALLLREIGGEKIRIGLRSNQWVNVNEIAARYGGGGHQRAAGCTLQCGLDEAKEQLIIAVGDAL